MCSCVWKPFGDLDSLLIIWHNIFIFNSQYFMAFLTCKKIHFQNGIADATNSLHILIFFNVILWIVMKMPPISINTGFRIPCNFLNFCKAYVFYLVKNIQLVDFYSNWGKTRVITGDFLPVSYVPCASVIFM